MAILARLARWAFVLCLPLFAITISIAWGVNSTWLYTAGFHKYDVRASLAATGLQLTDSDMKNIAREFVAYFNSGEEYIHLTVPQNGGTVDLFNQEEVMHFKDVKDLFRLDYSVAMGTGVYLLAFVVVGLMWGRGKQRRVLARTAVIGGGISLGLMALVGLGIAFDFDTLFYDFHLISFSNNYWSAEGNMLLLFPGGFWYDITTYIAFFAAGLVAIVTALAGIYLWGTRRAATKP